MIYMKNKEDAFLQYLVQSYIKEIYNYLGAAGDNDSRRDSIIEAVRGGDRLEILFSDEEFIILSGMITEFDRDIKLNKILDSVILETKNIRQS